MKKKNNIFFRKVTSEMLKNKYVFVAVLLLTITVVSAGVTGIYLRYENDQNEDNNITVVASFYPIYIAAMNVVGNCDDVDLKNLSEPQTGCLHDYQLTPADMKLLSTADVFLVNGGGIESFLSDIAKQYPDLKIVDTTENIELLEDNAHAWLSPLNYIEQVNAIEKALSESDTKNSERYKDNARIYTDKVQKLEDEIQAIREKAQRNIIIFHEAYEYIAQEFGLNVSFDMDLDEERQVSAGEVAEVLDQIKNNNVKIILAEELYGKGMGDTVEKESDVKVYYLDALTRGNYDIDSYLTAMEDNIRIMKEALAQ